MKITIKISAFFTLLTLVVGCGEEEFVGQPGTNNVVPSVITDISYEATPGGAIISYTPPSDEDFSHVEAVYNVSAILERKSTSTKYTQHVLVEGFGDTTPQQVDLYAVDKSGNRSDIASIEVIPDTPPYITIFERLEVKNGFGGVFVDWENDGDERVDNIGFTVLKADKFGDYVPYEVIYDDNTKSETSYSVRGLDTLEVELRFFVRDKFNHVSDTLVGNFKPLFEIEIDHNNVTPLELDTDALTDPGSSLGIMQIADGKEKNAKFNTTSQHYHSIKDLDLSYFPLHITLDLSVETNLSRLVFFPTWWDAYKNGGIKRFELYGTNDQSLIDRETNGSYEWTNGDDPNVTGNWREEGMDGWEYIGEYETTKPSGLPDTQVVSNEDGDTDRAFSRLGFEYQMPAGTSYRYVRLRATELWADGLEYISLEELRFYGGPKK